MDFLRNVKQKKCCVVHCQDIESSRHRFPKNEPDVYNAWVKNVNNPLLTTLSPEEVYKKFLVCNNHFAKDVQVRGTKRGLTKTAVPTLNLHPDADAVLPPTDGGSSEPSAAMKKTTFEDLLEGIPCKDHVISENEQGSISDVDNDHQYAIPRNLHKDKIIPGATSQNSTSQLNYLLEHDYCSRVSDAILQLPDELNNPQPSSSNYATTPNTSRSKKPRQVIFSKGLKRRRLLLREVNVSRATELSPKAKRFYELLTSWSIEMTTLQRHIRSYKERLENAERVATSAKFQNLLKFVNFSTYRFIMTQVRNQNLPPRGRKYTLEEKILAITILKASGKGYRLLSKIFALPTKNTLSSLLNKIPFKAGINEKIFAALKNSVRNMCPQEKCCIIVFDEISLEPTIKYNIKEDCISGIEDFGTIKRRKIADHSNVFMVNGVYRQWRQPIVFTFSDGPVKAAQLKSLLKDIIKKCFEIGLDVVATVCDQGAANRSAINMLLRETAEECTKNNKENLYHGFLVDGKEIVPLFDIPHLFKGLRNNLLTKNLHYSVDGKDNIASWEHIQQFYYLDKSEEVSICSKLTDRHVLKHRINKMKVSLCSQVFSNTVGSLMKRISEWDINDKNKLDQKAAETADLLLFLDKLFDSLNVSAKVAPKSKPLKGGVTSDSPHEHFWRQSLQILDTMKFFCEKKKVFVSNPSISNLKFTIHGFLYLKRTLLEEKEFDYILTRAFNQDPLENFFGKIRSHGFRNTAPDVNHFVDSFKALLTNNFTSRHSPNANCEDDVFSEGVLNNLKCFLTYVDVVDSDTQHTVDTVHMPDIILRQRQVKVARCAIVYVAGFIAKKLSQLCKACENCKKNVLCSSHSQDTDFIEARQYEHSHLTKPGSFLQFLTSHSLMTLFYVIPRICNIASLSVFLEKYLLDKLNFTPIKCLQHPQLDTITCKLLVKCALFWWTKKVNAILKAKDSKFIEFLKTHPEQNKIDPIKYMAYLKYMKKYK